MIGIMIGVVIGIVIGVVIEVVLIFLDAFNNETVNVSRLNLVK